jgi:uncharacterized protein (TIGR03118 family)
MKKNQRQWFAQTVLVLLAFFMTNTGCKKTDLSSSVSSASSQNDAALSFRGYKVVGLVANRDGLGAQKIDPRLQNAWGLSASDGGTIWLSANETGLSFVYDTTGTHVLPPVSIPSHTKKRGNPTGNIFNATTDFIIPGTGAPARFIFADEGGTISAWNSANLAAAVKVADKANSGAVYKGLAMASNNGNNFLYVTNFSKAKIDVFDKNFKFVTGMSFKDPNLPKGYAPFNIRNIDDMLYVTYALQTADKGDDSSGAGHGFVDIFKPTGEWVMRFASRGKLNSPWGITKGKREFLNDDGGDDDILIGNFGDGRINVFDHEGKFLGQLMNNGHPIVIDGLWAIDNTIFGTGSNQLYFTAGPNDEADGLFGYLMKR